MMTTTTTITMKKKQKKCNKMLSYHRETALQGALYSFDQKW